VSAEPGTTSDSAGSSSTSSKVRPNGKESIKRPALSSAGAPHRTYRHVFEPRPTRA
jgi:hypothetical protein